MRHNKVGSVMTTDVVRAEYGTPFKEVAQLLASHRISGLPVVDEDDKVVGVLSETDLMMHQATTPDPYEPKHRARLAELTPGAKRRTAKGKARTAGELMTEPPSPCTRTTPSSRPPAPWSGGTWNGSPCSTRRTGS